MREKQNDSDKTDAQLKPIATALLSELNKVTTESSVEAIGDVSVIAGSMVQVSEKMTGISGGFVVITDSHTFSANGKHTMSLKVSKTLELNEIQYEPPDENTDKSSSDTSKISNVDSGKSSKVIDLARSFIGKLKYAYGGKNIAGGSGDCSGFTQYVYQKAVGLNLGYGTSTQLTKGDRVAKDKAQTGDLIFFQGTYRAGVSHVGIVTEKGSFVNLQNDGCIEESYTSGYWSKHYMEIRRVL
jgi:cell wall-associated NlpC family hydrolase